MQLICVSRGTLAGGKELAARLCENLGYRCLCREELTEAATNEGIQVGRLEAAMLKPGEFTSRLSLEREHYLAFTTDFLCRRALEGDVVYHGRQGHLVLPGVGNVLRVRVVADREYRIRAAVHQLGVSRDKARRYVEDVDEDRRRWARAMYGVLWEDVAHYDLVLNLERMSPVNAAAAVTSTAQLPDFQMTPASRKALQDLGLASRARVLLARDDQTSCARFKTTCTDGVVTVTYLPEDARLASQIPRVVGELEGMRDLRATMASTNIVWIQETFDPAAQVFGEVVEVAAKWDAAVALLRFAPEEEAETTEGPVEAEVVASDHECNGGVEDDMDESAASDNEGLEQTVDALAWLGRTGGGRSVRGGPERLLEALHHCSPCTMVVVGDVFLSKGHAARTRMARDLRALLADHVKAPVVLAEELRTQYLFGKSDALRLVGLLALTCVLYALVMTHQVAVLKFLTGHDWKGRLLSSVSVFLFVPVVAHLYGTVARTFLKLLRME